jgi:hypothetical protein
MSTTLWCTNRTQARVTPFTSLYILDFVDNNGTRIEARTGLVVFDGQEGDPDYHQIEPVGRDVTPDCELEIYFLHPTRRYEIRNLDGQLLRTITFSSQVTTTVQCE